MSNFQDTGLGGPILQASVSFAASGDNTIITGVTGKIFKVTQIFLVLGAASNLIFKSNASAISGTLTMLANGSVTLDLAKPLTGLATGDAFVINSSNAVTVGGTVWYVLS